MGRKVLARKKKRVEDDDVPACSSRMLPNDLAGRNCVLNTSVDIDLNLTRDECCLQHCRALPRSPVSAAVVSLATHATSTGSRLERAEPLVSRESREELAERVRVQNRENVGLRRRRKALARKRKFVGNSDSSASLSKDLAGKDCVLDGRCDDSRGRQDELSNSIERWNTNGNMLATNGCRSIARRSSDEDRGFEKGSETSTSAKNEFLELDDTQVGKAEIANGDAAVSGEQSTDAECGEVAEGDQETTATKKLPPSIIVSNGGMKSSTNPRFYCPLPEKEIKDHVTAQCGHDMSQEAISSSTPSTKLYDVIKAFSQRRAKRPEKGDILTIAIEKGIINLPPVRWWRPGGYNAELFYHGMN